MSSKWVMKNAQNQEFGLEHEDGTGALSVKTKDLHRVVTEFEHFPPEWEQGKEYQRNDMVKMYDMIWRLDVDNQDLDTDLDPSCGQWTMFIDCKNLAQGLGDSSEKAISQKAVTDIFNNLEPYKGSYGIVWNETDDTYIRTGSNAYTAIQSLMKRCVVKNNGDINYFLHPDNSNYKEDGTASKLDGTDGNVMVQIPKFYYKYEYVASPKILHKHSISLEKEDGYEVHPMFVKNGVEVDYRYYGAYQGYSSGGKLISRSGVYPTVEKTRATFRAEASANGSGWHQLDFLLYEGIALLAIIEFGTMDLQNAIGEGRTALGSSGTWVGGSYIGLNGHSNKFGNKTANFTYKGNAGDSGAVKSFMSYRGIENLFGNIWRFVDGINCKGIVAKAIYINQNPATYADDVFNGDYKNIGVTTADANGYGKALANSRMGFFPTSTVGGDSSSGTTDYYYTSATENTIALVGGAADGLAAGVLCLSVNNASSHSAGAIGSVVCR